jgi:hypothetical protein
MRSRYLLPLLVVAACGGVATPDDPVVAPSPAWQAPIPTPAPPADASVKRLAIDTGGFIPVDVASAADGSFLVIASRDVTEGTWGSRLELATFEVRGDAIRRTDDVFSAPILDQACSSTTLHLATDASGRAIVVGSRSCQKIQPFALERSGAAWSPIALPDDEWLRLGAPACDATLGCFVHGASSAPSRATLLRSPAPGAPFAATKDWPADHAEPGSIAIDGSGLYAHWQKMVVEAEVEETARFDGARWDDVASGGPPVPCISGFARSAGAAILSCDGAFARREGSEFVPLARWVATGSGPYGRFPIAIAVGDEILGFRGFDLGATPDQPRVVRTHGGAIFPVPVDGESEITIAGAAASGKTAIAVGVAGASALVLAITIP